MLNKLFDYFGYYKLDDLQIGGHCGICGKIISDEIFKRYDAWGICEDCEEIKNAPIIKELNWYKIIFIFIVGIFALDYIRFAINYYL
jgi:hypothetical protein